ncbi:DNA-binding protein [Limnobacter humi]|uniref:DNA-binding protein n=1 Tax=Limnobacter humi TaxID=1778671 RepID=A0ABT1WKR1_9BURK|nr:PPC domain-containing DNA-binding protein [Limnobacter humi]MCQ8897249.1 DNA-binding protein [Limnobacter humi]
MNPIPVRLCPGNDLRRSLERLACAFPTGSGFVLSGIGSLADASIRLADQSAETTITGPLELLSVSGSLSQGGAHLHVSVADASGRVIGGHLGYGTLVRTTAEILLVSLDTWTLVREVDEITGFKELVARPVVSS